MSNRMHNMIKLNKFLNSIFENKIFLIIGWFSIFVWQGFSFGKLFLFHLFIPLIFLKLLLSIYFRQWSFQFDDDFIWPILVWTALGAIWGGFGSGLGAYTLYWFCGAMIFCFVRIVIKSHDDLAFAVKCLAFFYGIHLIISFGEGLGLIRYPISLYSDYSHLFLKKKAEILVQYEYYRTSPTSFYWATNFAACVTSLGFSFIFLIRNFWAKFLYIIVHLFLLVQASSKGFMIGFLLQLILFLVYEFRQHKARGFYFITFIIGISFGISRLTFFGANKLQEVGEVFGRIKEYLLTSGTIIWEYGIHGRRVAVSETADMLERASYMATGVRSFLESWGLGIGANQMNQRVAYALHGKNLQSMHNFFFENLAMGGIILILIWLIWFVRLTLKLKTLSSFSREQMMLISLMLSLFIASFVESSLVYFFPFYLTLALSAKASLNGRSEI